MTEHPSTEAIISRVAERYGVSVSALLSDRRGRSIAWPRHVAMYMCRRHTPFSLPRIGRAFGNRDHSTVMYACDRVQGQMDRYPEKATEVETLSAEVAALQPVPGRDHVEPDLYGVSKEGGEGDAAGRANSGPCAPPGAPARDAGPPASAGGPVSAKVWFTTG